jgi:hypothetical protein
MVAVVLGAVVLACQIPLTEDEVSVVLRRIAGAGPDAVVMSLFAGGEPEAWVRVVEARTNGPISESRSLALGFERAARKPVVYVVGGPFFQLNDRVLLDAFTLCKEARLPGLEVIYVSPEAPSEELGKTARAYGVRVKYRVYEDGR